MATFTMYLHDAIMHAMDVGRHSGLPGAISNFANDDDLLIEDEVNARIRSDIGYKAIGLADYPIFDANYRSGLNYKIVDHYWNREIGVETLDLFIQQLRRRMNEIMPYYNQLYESERIKFDPLITMRIDSVNDGTATSVNDSDSVARVVNSETPQTMLAGNEDYASSATDSHSKGVATSEGATESKAHSEGFSGSQSDLLNQYRSTFLNIDLMVIAQLEDLFMQLWSNGDEFTPNRDNDYWYGNSYGGMWW